MADPTTAPAATDNAPLTRPARQDGRVLARLLLSRGRHDLSAGQSPAARAAERGTPQEPAAGSLGREPGPLVHVRAPEPDHQQAQPGGHLPRRPRPRRPGRAGPGLPGGHLLGDLPQQERGRGGHEGLLQAILLPGRHRLPLHPGDPRLHPRGRRARLLHLPRLRGRLRQPEPPGGGRGRRRRGRDRTPGNLLALQQVPESHPRRGRAADPSSQRLQDQQPDTARTHPQRRTGEPDARLRLDAPLRRGRRPHGDASEDGGDPGRLLRRDTRLPGGSAQLRQGDPLPLAHDRAAHPQGLDRPQRGRRSQGGRILARPSGAPVGHAQQRGALEAARRLDEELQARGAVRRQRPPDPGAQGPRPQGHNAHERQPPCQWGAAAPGPAHARLPGLCPGGTRARARSAP